MDNPEPPGGPVGLARAYYESVDAGNYERLRGLLTEGFVQERPDRRLKGADRFVKFMREERPETNTTHIVDEVYTGESGVAVRGRLLRADGSEWFAFVDSFDVENGRLAALETFTR